MHDRAMIQLPGIAAAPVCSLPGPVEIPVRFGAQTPPAPLGVFYPAKPNRFILSTAYWINRLQLRVRRLKVELPPADLHRLQALPPDAGLVMVANHSSPRDRWVMMELARRWGRPMQVMASHEAFQYRRWLGWLYQRIGAFSIQRGQANDPGKLYAQRLVRDGIAPLLMFPESEETFQTDKILPFKTGTASIALSAAARSERPVMVVPVVMRYRYQPNLLPVMKEHMGFLEAALKLKIEPEMPLHDRLDRLMHHLLDEWSRRYKLPAWKSLEDGPRLERTTRTLLSKLETKYKLPHTAEAETFRAFRLLTHLEKIGAPRQDREAANLARWLSLFPVELLDEVQAEALKPAAYEEKLANVIGRLELELLQQWPPPMQDYLNKVEVRVGEPVDVRPWLSDYGNDKAAAIQNLTARVHTALEDSLEALD